MAPDLFPELILDLQNSDSTSQANLTSSFIFRFFPLPGVGSASPQAQYSPLSLVVLVGVHTGRHHVPSELAASWVHPLVLHGISPPSLHSSPTSTQHRMPSGFQMNFGPWTLGSEQTGLEPCLEGIQVS